MEFGVIMYVKTIWVLLVLFLTSIPCALVTLLMLLAQSIMGKTPQTGQVTKSKRKCVLVSGGKMTKSLEICRAFKAEGHRVILVETEDYWFVAPRWSNAVDKFVLLPEHKRTGERAYVDKIKSIIKEEQVDVFVPVAHTVDVVVDALVKEELDGECFVWCEDLKKSKMLDHKYTFLQEAEELGLRVPKHYLVSNKEQAITVMKSLQNPNNFFLKSIASDPINRTKLRPVPSSEEAQRRYVELYDVRPDNPHLMMQFLRGKEYCTTSIINNGKILLHTTSPSSAVQLNYEHENIADIEKWVRKFAEETKLTGSHSFDFMLDKGTAYPIECNPRLHSAVVNFYNDPKALVESYLSVVDQEEDSVSKECRYPTPGTKESFWLYNELMHLCLAVVTFRLTDWGKHIKTMCKGREAIGKFSDPIPFFWMHHVQIPVLLLKALVHKKPYTEIDFNVGKLHWAH
mmetsp:Transcript_22834/g.29616  ORF Transcript_22834/g.29616 Transcript_22834/m.29616 type:complete len:457 (+) Transcript_22834:118-1488(+)